MPPAARPCGNSGSLELRSTALLLAFQNRAELGQQLAQRNIGERRRIALSDLGPQVGLVASYSPSDTFNDDVNLEDNYSVGERLTEFV